MQNLQKPLLHSQSDSEFSIGISSPRCHSWQTSRFVEIPEAKTAMSSWWSLLLGGILKFILGLVTYLLGCVWK